AGRSPRGRASRAAFPAASSRRRARRAARACRRHGRRQPRARGGGAGARWDASRLASTCAFSSLLYHSCMARKPYRAVADIDPAALAEFRAGIRRRYTNDQILEALRASAERLGRSPTMKEFAADPEAAMHPQTVIEH